MTINYLNKYGMTRAGQVEYYSELFGETVLLVGESARVNNPKNLPVYWPSCLDAVNTFIRLGGSAQELHGYKKLWPMAKLETHPKDPLYWDHCNLPMVTKKVQKRKEPWSVFRYRESLSEESIKKLKRESYRRLK